MVAVIGGMACARTEADELPPPYTTLAFDAVAVRSAGVTVPVPAAYVNVYLGSDAPEHVFVPVCAPTTVVAVIVVTQVAPVAGVTTGE
jgi:hypothetical protein